MNAPSMAQSWAWKFLDQLAEWRSLAVERYGFVQVGWVLVMLYFSTCTKVKKMYIMDICSVTITLCFMKALGKEKGSNDFFSSFL